jgi:hypothetical protein
MQERLARWLLALLLVLLLTLCVFGAALLLWGMPPLVFN